jgi:hypothetical protein
MPESCPEGDIFWKLLGCSFIPALSVVFRRDLAMAVGMLRTDLHGLDDWDLWVKIAERHRVLAVCEPVGVWRESAPASGQGSSDRARICLASARHQLALFKLPRAAAATRGKRRLTRNALLRQLTWSLADAAVQLLREGATADARASLLAAGRLRPLLLLRPGVLKLFVRSLAPHAALR